MSTAITFSDQVKGLSGDNNTLNLKDIPNVNMVDEEALSLKANLRDNPDAREDFLSGFSAEESKKIISKVDKRFFILIGLMFLIKNLDSSNASNVKVLQVGESRNILTELNMSADDYNWVGSIYGIAYITFDLPSNLLLKYFTPRLWQTRIFLFWGVVTMCCAAVKTGPQLLACRFLIGMAEAGMFPGVITHLAYWYRTDEFSRPMVWFFAISNLAGIVGSLLCYAISFMNGLQGLSAWRWVFIIEGILTIILSGFIFWILPDLPKSPRSQSWLTDKEQEFIETRLPLNAPITGDKNFDWKQAWQAFRSPSVYGFMFCQTFMNLALAAFNWYLPTIITNFGFVGLPTNQLLNIPPIAAGIFGIIFSSWFQSRGFVVRPAYVNVMVLGNLVFLVVLAYGPDAKSKYVACILSNLFSASFYPPYWSWRAGYLTGATGAAFALGLQSAVSNVGSVVSPQFFQSKWASDGYRNSFIICIALVVAAQLSNLYTWWLTRKVERQVLRVRREVLKSKKEGLAYNGHNDIDVLGDDNIKNRRVW